MKKPKQKKTMNIAEAPRPEVRKYPERPKFGNDLLQLLEPTLVRFREDPKTERYFGGIVETVRMFGDTFLATPRPSGREEEITARLAHEAQERGWYAEVDTHKNIGMVIPATPGYEEVSPMLVHFHTDIVAAAGKNAKTNPEVDPIKPQVIDINGEQWVRADDDTSVGSDDGGGAASLIQAALDMANEKDEQGNPLPHGPVLLFGTSREEVGLEGMDEFVKENTFNPEGQFAQLLPKVERILNSDGEQVDRVTIGALGGEIFKGALEVQYEPIPQGYEVVKIKLDGFRGGHSGKYAKNPAAISSLAELISCIDCPDVRVVSLGTRNKFDNALSEDAEIVLAAPQEEHATVLQTILIQGKTLQNRNPKDKFSIGFEVPSELPAKAMDSASSQKTLTLFTELRKLQGVASSSDIFGDDLLERSMNIGVLNTEGNAVNFIAFSRIRKSEMYGEYQKDLQALASKTGMAFDQTHKLPIWEPDMSRAQQYEDTARMYEELFGEKPRLEFAPGGMEMSIFAEVYPNALMLSNGVTIEGAHTAGERMLARSLPEVYIWNRQILARWRDELIAKQAKNIDSVSSRRGQVAA